jgi:hypothetical protein
MLLPPAQQVAAPRERLVRWSSRVQLRMMDCSATTAIDAWHIRQSLWEDLSEDFMSACQIPTVVTVPYASTLLCCFQLSVARCTQRSVCNDRIRHGHHNIRSPPSPKQHQASYQYDYEVLNEVFSPPESLRPTSYCPSWCCCLRFITSLGNMM